MAVVTKDWIQTHVTTISAFGGKIDKHAVMEMRLPRNGVRTTLTWALIKAVERGRYRRPFGILIDGGTLGLCWAECRSNGNALLGGKTK